MGLQPTPYVLAVIAGVLACLPVTYVAWGQRDKPGARPLAVLCGAASLWGAGVLVATVPAGRGASLFWLQFVYAAITLCVLSWFLFTLEYTGRDRLVSDRALAALSVEPVLMTLLVWSNDLHGLVWTELRHAPSEAATGVVVESYGLAFWVHTVYSYGLVVVGIYFVLQMLYRSRDLYRGQAAALVVGVVAPLVGNLVYIGGFSAIDVTPAGFAVSGVTFGYAMFRFELMNLTPVARNTVVDNISDGVFVLDRNDRVIDINPMAKRILGIDAENVVGCHAKEVLSVYPGLYERYRDTVQTQEEIGLDDGDRRRYFHIQVSPLHDSRDRRVGRLFLVHDITDQKRRQQELRRQNQRLDQFASLVSHDLRNPLNVADGYVDIAMETGNTEYLEKVDESLDRMGQLIEDVLTLARQGQTITETESVELDDIASDAWGNVDTGEAVLEVRTDAAIEANYGRLLRVFENLFRNAVEHAGRDVRIRVGVVGTDDATAVFHPEQRGFYVEDDGPGIPEDQRDQVLQDGYTTSEDGTGLGLSIVRSIVEAHGWEIHVTEGTDGGARFEITGVDPAGQEREQAPARADGGE